MRLKEASWRWKHSERSYYGLTYTVAVLALVLSLFLYIQLGYHIIFLLWFFSIAAGTVYFSLESLTSPEKG